MLVELAPSKGLPRVVPHHDQDAGDHAEPPPDALSASYVQRLMSDGVPCFYISYKHRRKDRTQLEQDRKLVLESVCNFMRSMGFDRVLVWSDLVGRTVGRWAENGIEPYLAMPTMRLMSADLQEAIENSFWMDVEVVAASLRGANFTWNEDENFIQLDDMAYAASMYCSCVEHIRVELARAICTPGVFYKRTLFDDDKIEVLKYELRVIHPDWPTTEAERESVAGLLYVSPEQARIFNATTCSDRSYPFLKHNKNEITVEEGEEWYGADHNMPGIKALHPRSRAMERFVLNACASAVVIESEDNITSVLYGLDDVVISGGILKFRVRNFAVVDDAPMAGKTEWHGAVKSFCVATKTEEEVWRSSTFMDNVCVCFGEDTCIPKRYMQQQ